MISSCLSIEKLSHCDVLLARAVMSLTQNIFDHFHRRRRHSNIPLRICFHPVWCSVLLLGKTTLLKLEKHVNIFSMTFLNGVTRQQLLSETATQKFISR
jgi:hypothetical protein